MRLHDVALCNADVRTVAAIQITAAIAGNLMANTLPNVTRDETLKCIAAIAIEITDELMKQLAK